MWSFDFPEIIHNFDTFYFLIALPDLVLFAMLMLKEYKGIGFKSSLTNRLGFEKIGGLSVLNFSKLSNCVTKCQYRGAMYAKETSTETKVGVEHSWTCSQHLISRASLAFRD